MYLYPFEHDWMNASLMKKERTERKKAKAKRKKGSQ